jgi:hypothetical protein
MQRLNGTRPLARYEIASGSTIISGNLVALNAEGKAVPAADTDGLIVIGTADHVENGSVEVMDGVFSFANDTTHPLTRAYRGKVAFVKDADTVAASSSNSVPAGIVVDIYEGEVYLDVTPAAIKAATASDTDTTYGAATVSAAGLVKQAAAVADCTPVSEATSVETQLNALLAALRTAGILAPNAEG